MLLELYYYAKQGLKDVQILRFFKCIPASAAVNTNEIKTFFPNDLITFLSMGILFLVMDQEVYQEILLIASS